MQRHILPFVLVLSALTLGRAPVRGVPAYPRPVRITQSDGSQLLVRIVGDERYHYFLSEEGYTLTAARTAIFTTPRATPRGGSFPRR